MNSQQLLSSMTQMKVIDPIKNEDDDLVFIWEDFTVTRSGVDETDYLLQTVTPEWLAFCQDELQFALPEDLQQAMQQ